MANNEGSQRRQDISTTDNVAQDEKDVKKVAHMEIPSEESYQMNR